MRLTAILWLIGVCVVCASTRSDQTGPVDVTLAATTTSSAAPLDPSKDPVYVCPMDPDVRSHNPGTCRRCGMNLVAGIPDPVEFHLDLDVVPRPPKPAQPAALQFFIHDPWKDRPVANYNVVHEKLFHAFVVSEDLQFFKHAHPTFVADGVFQLPITFPTGGMFRVLGDFYPAGATPQLSIADHLRAWRCTGAGAAHARLLTEVEREHARLARDDSGASGRGDAHAVAFHARSR